ncbi:MAG: methylglyoxal synthase [Flavobacteriales bacterium]|nr:methylglyoxal synthase [Flavobacteriales bacterium]MDG1781913.1 methylglyoxal synthase [Flavobacteriales bacterium]MDG2247167.1 methylglyoxal synthase [Flavobacteriales bacterium]
MIPKSIAVIAHNKMKPVLTSFLKEREEWVWGKKLLATGLTADFVEQGGVKVNVEHLNPGKEGGYSQLRSAVEMDQVEMVLFFRDPEIEQDYEDEIVAFVKACNRKNIPLATNPASAELLILGLIKKEAAEKVRNRTIVE